METISPPTITTGLKINRLGLSKFAIRGEWKTLNNIPPVTSTNAGSISKTLTIPSILL